MTRRWIAVASVLAAAVVAQEMMCNDNVCHIVPESDDFAVIDPDEPAESGTATAADDEPATPASGSETSAGDSALASDATRSEEAVTSASPAAGEAHTEEEAGEGRGDAEPNEEPGDAPDEETTAEPPKAADAATATARPAMVQRASMPQPDEAPTAATAFTYGDEELAADLQVVQITAGLGLMSAMMDALVNISFALGDVDPRNGKLTKDECVAFAQRCPAACHRVDPSSECRALTLAWLSGTWRRDRRSLACSRSTRRHCPSPTQRRCAPPANARPLRCA